MKKFWVMRHTIFGVIILACTTALNTFAAGGDLDTTFTASVTAFGTAGNTSPARVVVVQPDGRILVGGFFTVVNGRSYNSLARLNADGTVDQSFNISMGFTNGAVNAIAVQPDGRILAGGTFNFFNGVQRNNLVRLNTDGSLDTTFNMGGTGFNSTVETITLQANGQILVGGSFVQYNGATVNRLARLNVDGSRDTTFTTNLGTAFNNTTKAIAVETDGQIVVGGSFTSVNGTAANEIARLNANGTLDTAFITNTGTGFNTNRTVTSLALQTDGRIVVGGNFTTFNGAARQALARLNDTGTLDTGFTSALSNSGGIEALQIQTDGRITVSGSGTFFGAGNLRRDIARVNAADGSLDLSFNAGTSSVTASTTLGSLALQPDGTIFVVGDFRTFNNVVRSSLVKLNPEGSVNLAFAPVIGASAQVNAIHVLPNDQILIGGDFSGVNESFREKIARLNADGTTDLTFNPAVVGGFSFVGAIAVQTDGKILIGGDVNSSNAIARLNSDGSLDATFTATASGAVNAIIIQPDGKILIGGSFNRVNGTFGINRIARLNADGTTDTTFNTGMGFDLNVEDLVLQANGQIVVGGGFTSYNGTSGINRIARLNADGTRDTAFTANTGTGFDVSVVSLALQPDGRILAGGFFNTFNSTSSRSIARLNSNGTRDTNFNAGTGFDQAPNDFALQPDGRILLGGNFRTYNGTARNHLARLNTDGSLDTSFRSSVPPNNPVQAVRLQADGRIIIGGSFRTYDTIPRFGIARVFAGFAIRGRVTDAANNPLPAIPVISTGPLSRVVLTDSNGDYSFESLPTGNYSVIPNSPAFVFTPTRADFPNLTADQTQNFMAQTIAVPPSIPPLTDTFPPRPNPDPTLWNLGILTQPPGAFDPLVTVSQQTGQLVITPRANQSGLHYNGYVAVNSFDFTGGQISVELVQAGTGGSQSIFSIGADFQNFSRFMVQSPLPNQPLVIQEVVNGQKQAPFEATMPMLMFQIVFNGQVVLNVAIPYDPVAHRFLRFRHLAATNQLIFETSPDASVYTERARGDLGERTVSAITVELAAGTGSSAGSPGPIIFDNLVTQVVNCRFAASGVTVNEGDGQVTLTVNRVGLTNLASSVEYSTADGTASQRSRYVAAAGVLSFAAGETSKTLQILLVDNALVEGVQNFNVFLGPGFGMGVTGPGRTIVTLNDNDTPPITANPLETTQFFVTGQYYDFLSRQPDAGGLAFWVNEITGPCNGNPTCISRRRWEVSNAFFYEQEFQQTGSYVYRVYRTAFGNAQPFPNSSGDMDTNPFCTANPSNCQLIRAAHVPSYGKFVNDRARVVGGTGLAASQLSYATAFANRPEFRQRYALTLSTAAQFVDALLATVNSFGVDLSSQRAALISLYDATAGNQTAKRGAVLYRLADDNAGGNPINNRVFIDAEYSRAFVLTQYFGYLRRDPDIPGLNFWLGIINRFPLRAATGQNAMVCAFITSWEYQTRFSTITPRTDSECPTPP